MLTFTSYLSEMTKVGGQLHVFDIDDTLVHPTAKINVVDRTGKVKHSLSTSEYAEHEAHKKLEPGHRYDFSEFRSAKKFHDESKPIHPMLHRVRKAIKAGHHVIFNTARANLDNKKTFLDTFRKHGIDMNKVHVIRVGNMKSRESGAQKKARVVHGYINKHKYSKVHMYDDSKPNLDSFKELKKAHPNTELVAHHVRSDGSTRKV